MNENRGARDFLCPKCRNKIGQEYPDGHVLSRFRGRSIRIVQGAITCEDCDETTRVDKGAHAVVA